MQTDKQASTINRNHSRAIVHRWKQLEGILFDASLHGPNEYKPRAPQTRGNHHLKKARRRFDPVIVSHDGTRMSVREALTVRILPLYGQDLG